ncbi:mechanosensitive ion channel family protein [Cochlodiniinecator piscidefendens]|uniref:mechanosensitive ion channel family protein n=1 Tax=Cochlodiniinecator piscidefendens TaxID=2715756 RepID=UPI001E54761E|nr:mechanosensitive ion channel domain-containing protein [Cochlodiniinecator piscidefendens]
MAWFSALIFNVITAAIILVAAFWLSGLAKKLCKSALTRNGYLDDTLAGFLASMARYAVLIIAAIFVLNRFGIETTSLVALIGAAGLAIGLALQGTLSNFAAGVMLSVFRPFKIGDFIEGAGQSGTVKEITLFTTELATPDNVQIIVPNADMWSSAIKNYSFHPTRRVDMVFGVSYGTDLKKAEKIMLDLIQADSRILSDPEHFLAVTNLGDSSVDFTMRVWCDAADYWTLKFDMTRAVKEAFDTNKIDIPFPTQTLFNVKG